MQVTPFGLLACKAAKLEDEAAIASFLEFFNDKPQSFVKLFDGSKQMKLVAAVNPVKEKYKC